MIYFAYGSNLGTPGLQAKGIAPRQSWRGTAPGWKLVCDLPNPFWRVEGGVFDVAPATGEHVVGVLHDLDDAQMQRLDRLESRSIAYERVQTEIVREDDVTVSAFLYSGLEHRRQAGLLPSKRYLGLVLRGAREMKLSDDWLAHLAAFPTHTLPSAPAFAPPEADALSTFSVASLAGQKHLFGFAGWVFDMRDAPPGVVSVFERVAGLDVTMMTLISMEMSDGTETVDNFLENSLSAAQMSAINLWLHEHARVMRLAGRLDYREALSGREDRNDACTRRRRLVGAGVVPPTRARVRLRAREQTSGASTEPLAS